MGEKRLPRQAWRGNPQLEDGYTRIAHELLAALERAGLSPVEHAIVSVVLRASYGDFGRKQASLSTRELCQASGAHPRSVRRALARLVDAGIVKVVSPSAGRRPQVLAVNKTYTEWKSHLDPSDLLTRRVGRVRRRRRRKSPSEGLDSTLESAVACAAKGVKRRTLRGIPERDRGLASVACAAKDEATQQTLDLPGIAEESAVACAAKDRGRGARRVRRSAHATRPFKEGDEEEVESHPATASSLLSGSVVDATHPPRLKREAAATLAGRRRGIISRLFREREVPDGMTAEHVAQVWVNDNWTDLWPAWQRSGWSLIGFLCRAAAETRYMQWVASFDNAVVDYKAALRERSLEAQRALAANAPKLEYEDDIPASEALSIRTVGPNMVPPGDF